MFRTHRDMPPCSISLASMERNKTGSWRTFKPVLDKEKCTQCTLCWKFCPEACIALREFPEINYDYCKGCGICATECPANAISMRKE